MLFYSHLIIIREQHDGQNPSLVTRADQFKRSQLTNSDRFRLVLLLHFTRSVNKPYISSTKYFAALAS
jgi:hypothetical protein